MKTDEVIQKFNEKYNYQNKFNNFYNKNSYSQYYCFGKIKNKVLNVKIVNNKKQNQVRLQYNLETQNYLFYFKNYKKMCINNNKFNIYSYDLKNELVNEKNIINLEKVIINWNQAKPKSVPNENKPQLDPDITITNN